MDDLAYLFGVFLGASPISTVATVFIFDVPRDLLAAVGLGLSRIRKSPTPNNLPTASSHGCSQSGVTAVISSLNDAEGVLVSLASLRAQTLQPDRIIVFSDGSTDNSVGVLSALKQCGDIDMFISNDRRIGRAAAGNVALQYVETEFVLFIDCDTRLDPNALDALTRRLQDRPGAAACSGNITIANQQASIWTGLQQLEYMMAIDFGREFADTFGAMSCCSGALAMYRTKAIVGVGGFSAGSGEDLATTLRLRRAGYAVHFEANAWAQTNAPETLAGLVSQRLRWDRDAFRIQIVQFGQFKKQDSDESLANTLQRYDFLLFTFLPTVMLPFLVPILAQVPAAQMPAFVGGGYLFLVFLALLIFAPVLIGYRGRVSLSQLLLLPVLPLYQGIFMKIVRLYAYFSEAIYHASSHDHYVPAHIRRRLNGRG